MILVGSTTRFTLGTPSIKTLPESIALVGFMCHAPMANTPAILVMDSWCMADLIIARGQFRWAFFLSMPLRCGVSGMQNMVPLWPREQKNHFFSISFNSSGDSYCSYSFPLITTLRTFWGCTKASVSGQSSQTTENFTPGRMLRCDSTIQNSNYDTFSVVCDGWPDTDAFVLPQKVWSVASLSLLIVFCNNY
ncbi:hypothetical protein ACJIZ3_016666 [Penstemon smallii]|uniref:Uncharacterized protein n=1 Tax=Penstemon smallii TaxID=265156 RepID=A0ABD3STC6_9LAMI